MHFSTESSDPMFEMKKVFELTSKLDKQIH